MLVATFFGGQRCAFLKLRESYYLSLRFLTCLYWIDTLRRRDCCNFKWSYWQQVILKCLSTTCHNKSELGECLWEVLVPKRVFNASENSLQLYVLLFVLSLASTKKWPHTLCIAHSLSLRVSPFKPTQNTLPLINDEKKSDMFLLMTMFIACRFLRIGSSTKNPVFPRQICIALNTGCAEPEIITQPYIVHWWFRGRVFRGAFSFLIMS